MEQSKPDASIASDVLHNEDHSKLTQEEIAKAVAHHNKRHKEDHGQDAKAKGAQNKNQGAAKPK
jgi:hypothetical protein